MARLVVQAGSQRRSHSCISGCADPPARRVCLANIPYYRQLFDRAGVHPSAIRGRDDLHRIPVTRRSQLQGVPIEQRIVPGVDPKKCIRFGTSGTTGEPIQLLRSRREEYLLFGFRLRAQILSGLRLWDRRVKLGSAPVRLLPHRLGLFRVSNIDLNAGPEETFRQLETLKPDVIYGIPNMFEMLLGAAPSEKLRTLGARLLFSGAEPLRPSIRQELENVFGCPVVDFYGCRELNLLAWQCIQCGLYHTSDDSAVVEILKPGGELAAAGEQGEVYCTALHSFAMPVIRLEIGDVASRPAHAPHCRIGFETIERIHGRAADFLRLPGGRVFSPYNLTAAIDEVPGIRRFQIVQTALDEIEVLYVPLDGAGQGTPHGIAARCSAQLPSGIRVKPKPVDDIPLTAGGKHRMVRAFRPSSEILVPPGLE